MPWSDPDPDITERFRCVRELEALYERLGFLDGDGAGRALHEHCERRERCWPEHRAACRPDPSKVESHGVLPWVGRYYARTRLVVIGLNMNENGGIDAQYGGVQRAQRELHRRSRLRFGNPFVRYRGTFFDVRMLMYVWRCLRAVDLGPWQDVTDEELLAVGGDPDHPRRSEYADGYEWVALTNIVKCNPRARASADASTATFPERGSPLPEMLAACPGHVFARELEVLRPRLVLALGGEARTAAVAVCGSGTRVVSAPHPASQGRTEPARLAALDVELQRELGR